MKPAAAGFAVGCWLLAVGSGACGGGAAVQSCDDDLSGVWFDGERRWHAIDMRKAVELYPMFDSAETETQSAHALIFVRGPAGMLGDHIWWDGGRRQRQAAKLECGQDRLDIAYANVKLTLVAVK